MIQDRTCKQCGVVFKGGPRAYYCLSCRAERKKQAKATYQKRKRQGDVRALGSKDNCERCGKEYTVEGGLQRFCPECQPIHAQEYDRETSLEFYRDNKERINPPRKLKRRKRDNKCIICGTEFEPVNGSTTCSEDCKRKLANQQRREWYVRQKEKNAPPDEIYNMSKIASEIGVHKATVRNHYLSSKLPTPDGFYPSGRPYWYKKSLASILNKHKKMPPTN